MKVIVTGASGFIGSHTVKHLLTCGHDVIGIVRGEETPWRLQGWENRVTLERVAMDRLDEWQGPPVDAVVHLAWAGVARQDRNRDIQDDNVEMTVAAAHLAVRLGAHTWLGMGSQAEYGPTPHRLTEDDQCAPTTAYGRAKLAALAATREICESANIRWAWLRLFSSYGPGDNECWLLPSLINTLLAGKHMPLTEGEQLWDFVHAADVATAVAAVLDETSAEGVFNLGSGDANRLRDTISFVRDLIDPSARLGFGELAYRSDQVMHLEADIGRLQRLTGWKPSIELEAGLRETVEWYRERSNSTP